MTQTSDLTRERLVGWKDVRIFFLVMALFWLGSVSLLATEGYHGGFKWANQFQQRELGLASLYFLTHLGDGAILPMMLVIFMWRRDPALALCGIAAMLLTGLLTQGLKIAFFDDWMRPPAVFENDPDVVIFHPKPIRRHSFPSGHATSIASGGLMFAYFWAKRHQAWQVPVALFTLLLCYTRVLLGVHFPGDIFVGSVIGSLGSLATLLFLYPIVHRWSERWGLAQRGRLAIVITFVSVAIGVIQYVNLIDKLQ